MTQTKLSELAVNAISEVKLKVKELIDASKRGKFLRELPKEHNIDIETVKRATRIKLEMEMLESSLAALKNEYEPLRKEIISSLPGDEKDKIEVILDGIQIKKHIQARGGGIDQNKIMNLIKEKRLVTKVTKNVRIIDEDLLLAAIYNGDITYDEYMNCLKKPSIVQTLKLQPTVVPEFESKNDQEAI